MYKNSHAPKLSFIVARLWRMGIYSEYTGRGSSKYGRGVSPCRDRMKMEKETAVMVEKGDWRLIAGPVCGCEEKLKHIPLYSIPFQPLPCSGIMSTVRSVGQNFIFTKGAYGKVTAHALKTSRAPCGFAPGAMTILRKCSAGQWASKCARERMK